MVTLVSALALSSALCSVLSVGLANAAVIASDRVGQPSKLRAVPSFVCETSALVAGQTGFIGVHFKIEPGWHVYWNGLNDTGFPIELELTLPPGFKAEPTRWPAPTRHVAPGDSLDHIYEGSVTLIVPIVVPADASGTAELSAKLNWLVCQEACVPEKSELKLQIPVVAASAKAPAKSAAAKLFDEARARWPKALTGTAAEGTPLIAWSKLSVEIVAKGAAGIAFFPMIDCAPITDLLTSSEAKSDRLTMQLQPAPGVQPLLHGIIEVRYANKKALEWFEVNTGPVQ